MLDRVFPKVIDNRFRGHWLALWLFVPLLAMRLVIGANSMINAASVASGADGIPLGSFAPAASAEIVQIFALLGLAGLAVPLLGVVALIRYRAMIPLLYLLLTLQLIGNRVLHAVYPTVQAGAVTVGTIAVGTIVSYGLMALTLLGFALSLFGKGYSRDAG